MNQILFIGSDSPIWIQVDTAVTPFPVLYHFTNHQMYSAAYDPEESKLYWTGIDTDKIVIRKSNLDGSGIIIISIYM